MDSTKGPIITAQVDQLAVHVYRDRQEMGEAAGMDVATRMRMILAHQAGIRVVFAAAPSQNEFLDTLASCGAVDWSRVTVFQMDEYLGLPHDAPESFGRYLRHRLFDHVRPGIVHLIDTTNVAAAECERYNLLLKASPIDIVCLGIGENGHLAFNDPPVADFHDPARIKVVELDLASRQQQINDGCFPTLDAVPTHALTLTIPALMSGAWLSCVVPGKAKAEAIRGTLRGPVSPSCPASILRRHPNSTLYLDADSYGNL